MKQKSKAVTVALAVIRGETQLDALAEIGVKVSYHEGGYKFDSKLTEVLAAPSASDIARGLLTYRYNRDELRLWAFFVLAESGGVDLAKIESHPKGDALMEALWDASSLGSITDDAVKVAEEIATTPLFPP